MSLAAIVLCAGNGTRMKSNLPKVLHEIGSFPLIHHVMTTTCKLDVSKTIVVVGHQAEEVSKAAIFLRRKCRNSGTKRTIRYWTCSTRGDARIVRTYWECDYSVW